MPTKKQSRAAQKRRLEHYEAKLAIRRARRRKQQQVVGAITAGTLLLAGGAVAITTGSSPTVTPTSTLEANPTPTTSTPNLGPPVGYAEGREGIVTIETDEGPLTLSLYHALAPLAIDSFVYLSDQGYFDGTSCRRLVIDDANMMYILQCGDPTGTGHGDPDYSFGPVENDPDDNFYPAGTVAMARQRDNGYSMGGRFFIVYEDSYIGWDSAGGYTVFGMVTDGLDIVKAIAEAGTDTGSTDGRPAEPVTLRKVSVQ